MKRLHYANGSEIILTGGCDGCNPSTINGVLCHETGCPDAWKDKKVECAECGYHFYPVGRFVRLCDGCANPEPLDDPDDDVECFECGCILDEDGSCPECDEEDENDGD